MSTTIQRNLEKDGLYINRWITGLYQNRSPLYTPISAMGLQLLNREDALFDGSNMMLTPRFTVARRFGFPRFCQGQFASNEWPLNTHSFQDLSGNITTLVDTQLAVYSFTSSAITSVYAKTTTRQSSFEDVNNKMYWCDGAVAKKSYNNVISNLGIAASVTAPGLSYNASGSLQPQVGYKYVFVGRNSSTGHISTASPVSASTGPLGNQTIVQKVTIPGAPYQITVTNSSTFLADGGVVFDITSAPLTVVGAAPVAGQYVAGAAGVGTYTFAAGDTGKVVDITYSFSLALSTGVNIVVTGARFTDPQVDFVDIYRTADGGSQFFFLASIANPGGGTWTYTDSTLDDGLNDLVIAPVSGVNNPPPAGISLIVWHAGRLWASVGNVVYYAAGPDCLNGVGEEAWPALNNFPVQGKITCLTSTNEGLLIWTRDSVYVITGSDASTFSVPQIWQKNFGVSNQNCVTQDGDLLFFFTTRRQVFSVGTSGLQEIGFLEGPEFGAFIPANVYISVHRSGPDEGVFVSDGISKIYRYSQVANAWDPVYNVVGGCSMLKSIETSTEVWTLLAGRATGSGYILGRNTTSYVDDGTAYTCFVTVGSIVVAPLHSEALISSITTQLMRFGSYPTISLMSDEFTDTGTYPQTFTALPNPVPDNPLKPESQSLWQRRHYLKAAQRPLPQKIQHLQVKISFVAEAAASEILGLAIN